MDNDGRCWLAATSPPEMKKVVCFTLVVPEGLEIATVGASSQRRLLPTRAPASSSPSSPSSPSPRHHPSTILTPPPFGFSATTQLSYSAAAITTTTILRCSCSLLAPSDARHVSPLLPITSTTRSIPPPRSPTRTLSLPLCLVPTRPDTRRKPPVSRIPSCRDRPQWPFPIAVTFLFFHLFFFLFLSSLPKRTERLSSATTKRWLAARSSGNRRLREARPLTLMGSFAGSLGPSRGGAGLMLRLSS